MRKFFLIVTCVLFCFIFPIYETLAQGPGPPPPPPRGLFLDKGAFLILIIGAVIGAKFIMDYRVTQKKEDTSNTGQ